jgi:hypothetical protein
MFRVEYQAGFHARMDKLLGRVRDPQAGVDFMVHVGEDMIRLNRQARLNAIDWRDRPLIRWKVRKGPYKYADGPTLAPFGDDSRSIAWFGYQVKQAGLTNGQRVEMVAGWEDRGVHPRGGTIKILRYHAQGIRSKSGRIVRDLYGLTTEMKRAINGRFRQFADRMFGP